MARKLTEKEKIRFSPEPIRRWHKKLVQHSIKAEVYGGNNWRTIRFDETNNIIDPHWHDYYFWIYDDCLVSYFDWKEFTKLSDEEELLLKLSLDPSTNK